MTPRREPRAHPYLFFTREDLPSLRERARRAPHRQCHRLLLESAGRLLADPIPCQPPPGPPVARDTSGYLEDYLQVHYQFYTAAYALHYYGQVLAFAWLLDGREAFAARARDWALACASWDLWGPRASPCGLQAAHFLLGTTIVYDWLGEYLDAAERLLLRRAMRRQLDAFQRRWEDDLSPGAQSSPPHRLGTSAVWACAAAAGLASLALLDEQEEAPSRVEDWAAFFHKCVLPASFGRQGEFQEGTGWWDIYALRCGLLFFDALKRNGGPDLFLDPGLRAYPSCLLQSSRAFDLEAPAPTRPWARFLPPSPYHYRYALLRLAAALDSGPLFHLAGRRGLEVPRGTPLDWFYGQLHRQPCEPGRWYTVSLSWDRRAGRFGLSIDQRSWQVDEALAPVDGVRFVARGAGGGFRLRHLGARPEPREPTVLLESGSELQVGGPRGRSGDVRLRLDECSLDFPPAERGTLWFQICKVDALDRADIRLLCQGREGPGLRLAEIDLFPAQGAAFLRLDGEGHPAPPDGHPGGQVWFDGPWEYLWHREGPAAPPPPPGSDLFADAGWAFLRGERQGDPELRLRAGPCVSKDRGDQNGFCLSAGGETLIGGIPAAASGHARLTRRQFELDEYFLNTHAACALLVDGQAQVRNRADEEWLNPDSGVHSGHIQSFFAAPLFAAVCGEAGRAYPGLSGFLRRIAYIKPDFFVLADHVQVGEARRIEWRLHTPHRLVLDGRAARIEGERHQVEIALLEGEGPLCVEQTLAPLERERTPFLSLELQGAQVLAVLAPGALGHAAPMRCERLAARGGCGARIQRGSTTDLVLFRAPGERSIGAEGLRSDAAIAWMRRSGRAAPSTFGLVGATQLHLRGERLRCSAPADLCAHQTATRLVVRLQSAEPLEVRLAVPGPPRLVRRDGEALDENRWSYAPQGRRLVLQLEAGAHDLEVNFK